MRITPVCWLATLLAAVAPCQAQTSKVLPVDQAPRDPSLVRFRQQLLASMARRDTTAVLSAFTEDVHLDFGDGSGRELLRQRLGSGEDLWQELRDVLEHGGRFRGDSVFNAPYWFGADIEDDAFEVWVVIATAVRVRNRPAANGEVLASLSHDVVTINHQARDVPEAWGAVRLADGRAGFVAKRYLRSPIGYRVGFVKRNGRWAIRFFIAGD